MAEIPSWLGDKPWFKSVTVWGTIAIATGQAFVLSATEACGAEEVSGFICGALPVVGKALTAVGSLLAGLGLRRAVKPTP
jgi:hypothetical protein